MSIVIVMKTDNETLPDDAKTILIIDDDSNVSNVLSRALRQCGYRTLESAEGMSGLEMFRRRRPCTVLLDLKMPGLDGMQVLQEMKRIDDTVPVIIITAHGDIPAAVEAIKLGAYDFVCKPPEFDRLMILIRRAVESCGLMRTVRRLNTEVASSIESVLGASAPIKEIARQIHKVAHSDFSLMIQGETGTGKSFIARMIHDLSRRSNKSFVMVDIGSIPDTLLESELFGHEKGAFTGADRRKTGYFEAASGGTLFIDELENISPVMQAKLLAAVEERRVRLLGSTHSIGVDIRIICASNMDIATLVRDGRVREDLYYRLGEFFITLPPLRERRDDIRFFAQRFMVEAADDLGRKRIDFSEEAVNMLCSHSWPGNIRELKNVVRRAVLLTEESLIQPRHLQFERVRAEGPSESQVEQSRLPGQYAELNLAEQEKNSVMKALTASNGNKTKAALLLSISYKTLLRKLKRYGISS